MLFSKNLFAAFLAVAAVGVSGAISEVMHIDPKKREDATGVKFCEGSHWEEPCATPNSVELTKCYEFHSEFNLVNIESFGVPRGLECAVFESSNCTQPATSALLWFPGYDSLTDPAYNLKNGASSFWCRKTSVG